MYFGLNEALQFLFFIFPWKLVYLIYFCILLFLFRSTSKCWLFILLLILTRSIGNITFIFILSIQQINTTINRLCLIDLWKSLFGYTSIRNRIYFRLEADIILLFDFSLAILYYKLAGSFRRNDSLKDLYFLYGFFLLFMFNLHIVVLLLILFKTLNNFFLLLNLLYIGHLCQFILN